jgi:hypothetical protein
LRALAATLLLLVLWPLRAAADVYPVDLELVLAVDASGSVDDAEYALQLQGIAAALRDPEVQAAIAKQPLGRSAVALLIWSENNRPKDLSPWAVLSDAASIEAFATTIERWPRRIANGGTGIGKAMQAGAHALTENAFNGSRLVVDISGDGRETPPSDWSLGPPEGRAYAEARGVVINALAILTDDPELAAYFRREVIVGQDAFVLSADSYESFAEAMRIKLLREFQTEPRLSSLP